MTISESQAVFLINVALDRLIKEVNAQSYIPCLHIIYFSVITWEGWFSLQMKALTCKSRRCSFVGEDVSLGWALRLQKTLGISN